MNYWLHRVTHESEVSNSLLTNGYLSIGYSDFCNLPNFTHDLNAANLDKYFMDVWGNLYRGRFSLLKFVAQMQIRDIVLVPQGNIFSVYEIESEAMPVSQLQLPDLKDAHGNAVTLNAKGLLQSEKSNHEWELGFVRKVKVLKTNIPRHGYADEALVARMKILSTNANISDLGASVEKVLEEAKKEVFIADKEEIFAIAAKTCTLKNNTQENGFIILDGTKYIIPIYQRPYAWKNEQISKFIQDIFLSYWGTDDVVIQEPMFIGTMQLSYKKEGVQEIIDGQQRLSTFLILLKVLHKEYADCDAMKNITFNWLETRVNNGEQQKYLEEFIEWGKDFDEKSLNPYIKNAYLIEKEFKEQIAIYPNSQPVSEDSNSKVEINISEFVEYLLSKIYFVVIETRAGLSKTLQIFNSINTTGLDLNGGDLFKIRMYEYLKDKKQQGEDAFQKISELYQKIDTLNDEAKRNVTNIEHILFIYQHIIIAKYSLPTSLYSLGSNTFFERLFDSILNVNQWTGFKNASNVELSIDEIDKIIDARYDWENSHRYIAEDLYSLYFIAHSRYSRYWILSFIFVFRFKERTDYKEQLSLFVKQLAKVYVIYSARYAKAVNEIHVFSQQLVSKILTASSPEEVVAFINSKKNESVGSVKSIISVDIAHNHKVKSLLCRLSAMLADEQYKSSDNSIIGYVHDFLWNPNIKIDIEHIQSYLDKDKNRREDILKEWAGYMNSIGNLMILEQDINRSISNSEYKDKIQKYPKSDFAIVKAQVQQYPEWNLELCKRRKEAEVQKISDYLLS